MKHGCFKRRLWWCFRAACICLVLLLVTLGCLIRWSPFPSEKMMREPDTTWVTDREGNLLRMRVGNDQTIARPVPLERMSPWLGPALMAAEDKRFYQHPGIDPLAITRAVRQNVTYGRVISGASTITTQVMRMATPGKRNLPVKMREALWALQLEQRADKDTILEAYLNRAPFGSNLHGVESASLAWLGKSADLLSLGEAALLVGLPQSPSRFRPDRHLKEAMIRRDYVLDRMQAMGWITPEERADADAMPLDIHSKEFATRAAHFTDLVLSTGARGEVRSSLDPRLQSTVEQILERLTPQWQQQGIHDAALVILEVETGKVRALAGSVRPQGSGPASQVNMALAPRSAGSTLKPFLYAMALDQGKALPDTRIQDRARIFKDYVPENFDDQFDGEVPMRDALIRSLNLPSLVLASEVGVEAFHHRLRELGLESLDQPPEHYGLSLALGTGEVRLLDLVNAYACLARQGAWRPWSVLEEAPTPEPVALFSSGACALVTDMLSGPERSLEAMGHRGDTRLPRFAWKTGTSNGYRDAWTIGYNPRYVVGVWLGNHDGRGSGHLIGQQVAAPVVGEMFRLLDPNAAAPWYAPCPDIGQENLCAVSGLPACDHCTRTIQGACLKSIRPRPCTRHQLRPVDRMTGEILALSQASGAKVEWRVVDVESPPVKPAEAAAMETRSPLQMLHPTPDAEYLHLPGQSGQEIIARAQGGDGTYTWFLNGNVLSRSETANIPLLPGKHCLAVCDATGTTIRRTFRVRSSHPVSPSKVVVVSAP